MEPTVFKIEITLAELIDRITILEIKMKKAEKIGHPSTKDIISSYKILTDIYDEYYNNCDEFQKNYLKRKKTQLSLINTSLWEFENKVRDEHLQSYSDLGENAKNIFNFNDERNDIKFEINQLFDQADTEVKIH